MDVVITDSDRHPIDTFPELCAWCPIWSPTVTARTRAVRAVGGWAEWLHTGNDWHLYLKLARAGWRFAYLDRCVAHYRWPTRERGMSYDLRRRERRELLLWTAFAFRHPLTPGVKRALLRSLKRFVVHRFPHLRRVAVWKLFRRRASPRAAAPLDRADNAGTEARTSVPAADGRSETVDTLV
jgi:hypothetical protein